jgi:hypothetical protein
LKNNATQLIFPDLFCLQDGLKERELRVFIMDNGEELIPGYLEFIKEIVHYCLYFARGFCKNEESCRFSHGAENMVEVNGGGVLVSKIEELYLQQQNKTRDWGQQQLRWATDFAILVGSVVGGLFFCNENC